MSERIKVCPDSPAIHFAIESLASYNEKHKGKEIPINPCGYLDVEFKINGVEVSFAENIQEIYNRYEEDIDKRAAQKALDMYELKDLIEKMTDIQIAYTYNLKQLIAKRLGKTTQELFGEDD
jgi:hypothetical protein